MIRSLYWQRTFCIHLTPFPSSKQLRDQRTWPIQQKAYAPPWFYFECFPTVGSNLAWCLPGSSFLYRTRRLSRWYSFSLCKDELDRHQQSSALLCKTTFVDGLMINAMVHKNCSMTEIGRGWGAPGGLRNKEYGPLRDEIRKWSCIHKRPKNLAHN